MNPLQDYLLELPKPVLLAVMNAALRVMQLKNQSRQLAIIEALGGQLVQDGPEDYSFDLPAIEDVVEQFSD